MLNIPKLDKIPHTRLRSHVLAPLCSPPASVTKSRPAGSGDEKAGLRPVMPPLPSAASRALPPTPPISSCASSGPLVSHGGLFVSVRGGEQEEAQQRAQHRRAGQSVQLAMRESRLFARSQRLLGTSNTFFFHSRRSGWSL